MNRKTLSFVGLSAVFGIGAMLLAKNWLDTTQKELNTEQAKVAVATVNVATGTIISAKHVALQVYPKSVVPKGAVEDLSQVIGMVAKEPLYEKDIIRSQRLLVKGEGSTLASLISEHKRAVTIRVNDIIGVAGFLLPGNRVDILNTFQNKTRFNTEVILSNIKILAIDQHAAKKENSPQLVRAVTIEVDLEQAEILMNARSRGSLQLALRNPTDNNEILIAASEELPVIEDKSEPIELPKVQPVVLAPAKSRQKVELIRGVAQESIQVDI
jgi:pilus assembly protein CpaB